jgi:hypothetical protein
MSVQQLELDLWQQLAVAENSPEQVNVERLCLGLEEMLAQVPERQRLKVAGEALVQIAEVFSQRADLLLNDWKQAHCEEGPVLGGDALAGLMRQSMVLNLDALMVEPELVTRRSFPKDDVESVVAIVEKEVLLQELESVLEPEQALQVIEEEDVGAWVDAIATFLKREGGQVRLGKLLKLLSLSKGMVFLGLILGGFALDPEGQFYGGRIWVKKPLLHSPAP